jgi:hypothetical protein
VSTRPSALLAVALAASAALAGCGGSDPASEPTPVVPSTSAPASEPPSGGGPPPLDLPEVSADLAGDLQAVLDARARAVLTGDRAAFLDGVAPTPDLVTTEGGYFDNMVQLPLAEFSYRLLPASLVRTDNAYWGVVEVVVQLSPYDALPVRTVDRYRFAPGRAGGYRITSTRDLRWESENAPVQQPWDTEPIVVREGDGVLGVFDTADRRERAGIVASVERGILDVSARVPFAEWGSRAVVYALSDPRFLESFDDLPGGDPQALDGVAFTVPAGTDDNAIASTRIALSPDLLPLASARRVDPELDRLVRHELVHVALGEEDDVAPLWLGEGIAEWVSVQALPPQRREVPDRALAMATAGQLTTMPSDESFNDADASVHYALAWWVCEWLALTYGPDAPFTLLEAFNRSEPDADPREVIRASTPVTLDELARRGAELMAQAYAPEPEVTEPADPTETSTTAPGEEETTG